MTRTAKANRSQKTNGSLDGESLVVEASGSSGLAFGGGEDLVEYIILY